MSLAPLLSLLIWLCWAGVVDSFSSSRWLACWMSMLPCSMAQVGVVIVPREQVLRHSIVTLRIFPTIAHVKAGIPVATVFKLLPFQMGWKHGTRRCCCCCCCCCCRCCCRCCRCCCCCRCRCRRCCCCCGCYCCCCCCRCCRCCCCCHCRCRCRRCCCCCYCCCCCCCCCGCCCCCRCCCRCRCCCHCCCCCCCCCCFLCCCCCCCCCWHLSYENWFLHVKPLFDGRALQNPLKVSAKKRPRGEGSPIWVSYDT